jgi:uncharacterized protein (DUF4415 family)
MKPRKRVTPRRLQKQKKVSRRASAAASKHPLEPLPEWPGLYRPIKKPVTLRLDADVLAWFKRQGPGYQTRINRALRKLMVDERKKDVRKKDERKKSGE